MVVWYCSSNIFLTKRRSKLDFPTEKEPSMQIFFWSIPMSRSVDGSSAGDSRGEQGRKCDPESDAAIEAPAFFGAFIAQRLRSADAARKQRGGLDAVAQQRGANLIGALAAERKIGGLDARDIGVANQFDRHGLAQRRGLRHEIANILFGLREIGFLAGLQLGAAQREEQSRGLQRVFQRIQFL